MIKISDEAYEYLVIQHGRISDWRMDRKIWEEKYNESLHLLYRNICGHLPETAESIVDIGGGLSGISLLLRDHYPAFKPRITVVDGLNDPPVVRRHSKTFSNAAVAHRFLKANGLKDVEFMPPNVFQRTTRKWDLAISFSSFCFHVAPTKYISFNAGTKIFDVRHRYLDTARDLWGDSQHVIYMAPKFERRVWK